MSAVHFWVQEPDDADTTVTVSLIVDTLELKRVSKVSRNAFLSTGKMEMKRAVPQDTVVSSCSETRRSTFKSSHGPLWPCSRRVVSHKCPESPPVSEIRSGRLRNHPWQSLSKQKASPHTEACMW